MVRIRRWMLHLVSVLVAAGIFAQMSVAALGAPADRPLAPLGVRNIYMAIGGGGPLGTRADPLPFGTLKAVAGEAVTAPTMEKAAPAVANSIATSSVSPVAGCAANSNEPVPIVALVSALKCDWRLVSEWVYYNIQYEPLYGSYKGALGTLLDRRGSDADQVILLVTMLRAAGFTQAQVGYQPFVWTFDGNALAAWLNVPNDTTAMLALLSVGGIQFGTPTLNSDGSISSIRVAQFAAAINISGIWQFFAPSLKSYKAISQVRDIASILGYDRDSFLQSVGGVIEPYSFSQISRENIRSNLNKYANNILYYMKLNSIYSMNDLIGGVEIIGPLPFIGISSPAPSSSFPQIGSANCPYQDPDFSSSCWWSISITMPGASATQAIVLNTSDVYGRRITISSVQSGGAYVPTLLIDGAAPACVAAGTCTNVGTVAASGNWSIPVSLSQTNQFVGDGSCSTAPPTSCKTLSIGVGGTYLLSLGVGQVGRGMAEYHRQLLATAQAAGNVPSSDQVLGEALAVIGYNWLAETVAQARLTDRLAQTTSVYSFGFGIVGQANIEQSGYSGPYVDLPSNDVAMIPWSSSGPTTSIPTSQGIFTYLNSFISSFLSSSQSLSSFESAVLMQTQASVSGMTAASTIMLLDANMNGAFSGATGTTYLADGTTSAGVQYFNNNIIPAVQANYKPADLNAISAAVNAGAMVLLPANGQLNVGMWKGAGYTTIQFAADQRMTIAQKISGGMSGGFPGTPVPVQSVTDNSAAAYPPSASNGIDVSFLSQIVDWAHTFVSEPVDSYTGAYVYQHDDLVTGAGSLPYALPFSRTYSSANGAKAVNPSADLGLGNGWNHNWAKSIAIASDPYIGLGVNSAPAMPAATSLAALYVMKDLQGGAPTAQSLTLSAVVTQWFTDQLTNNVAQVSSAGTSEEFVAEPHGDGAAAYAFTALSGSSTRLAQTAAGFTSTSKFGDVQTFGPANPSASQPLGLLQSWSFPSGVAFNLGYNGAYQLVSVNSTLGRALTLAYGGNNDLTAVTDDSGRSVSYGYDGDRNLTSFTDPLGHTTTFAYDTSGTYDTTGRLTQVFYPSTVPAFVTNWYDPLGRVRQQANGNGVASQFYLAGSRSEIVDGARDFQVTYQNDHGRVIFKADGVPTIDNVTGVVTLDTPTIPGLVNVATSTYDGFDRLVSTTLPEGGVTTYVYDAAQNPWANNVLSVMQVPKPGSPLAARTTSYQYGPKWNKPIRATDPLGLVATTTYEPATGLPVVQVQDAGAAPHRSATTRFTYNSIGLPLTATNPLGIVTTFGYDGQGNVLSQIADAGGLALTTTFTYDRAGNQTGATDPKGGRATAVYDANRNLVRSVDPAGIVTIRTYDADNKLLSIDLGAADGPVRQLTNTYTNTGQVATVRDANGNVTRNVYDGDDRLISVTDALGRVTQYVYDGIGHKIGLYNTAIQSAPLAAWAYTPDGFLSGFQDANGHVTFYTADGFDRVSQASYPDGTFTTATYDSDNNPLTRRTRKGDTLTYQYDTLNRLAQKSGPGLPTVSYSYDLLGRQTSVSDTSAPIAAPQATASYQANWTYDADNRPTGFSYAPSVAQAAPMATSVAFGHAYDATNRRIGQSVSAAGWVIPPSSAIAVGYVANAVNQYTTVGSDHPTYDGNGNLTFDGTLTYGYDTESRLVSASAPGLSTSYAYDGRGVRKSKTLSGVTTITVTDEAGEPLLDYDGASGAVRQWVVRDGGALGTVAQVNPGAGSRTTFIPDLQGSVIASLDAGSGSLVKAGYVPYGQPSAAFPFGYTGLRTDAETGLTNNHARLYHPVLGRFIQNDPAGYAGGQNLYAYVSNDPLNGTDRNGRTKDAAAAIAPPIAIPGIGASAATAGGGSVTAGFGAAAIQTGGVAAIICVLVCPSQIGPELPIVMNQTTSGAPPDSTESESGPPASAPVGIEVQPGTNQPATIGNTPYSGHAIDRMQGRGIPPSIVTDTIQNGQTAPGNQPGTTTHYNPTNNVTVVTDTATGNVITVRKGAP